MKRVKSIVAMLLSMVMLLSTTIMTFADSSIANVNVVMIEDSSQKRIAEASDEFYTYRTIYDKDANTVQVIRIEKKTGEILNGDEVLIDGVGGDTGTSVLAATLTENTFTNYEYTKWYGSRNTWELRRPDGSLTGRYYFQTYEVSQNASYIEKFKSAVDAINVQEGEIILSFGTSGVVYFGGAAAGAGAIFTGGTLSAAAWGSILAAYGATTAHIALMMNYDSNCKRAYDSYMEVFTKSPEIFY